jgi:Zn-finger protein
LGDKCGGLFENRGSPDAKYNIKDCTNCYLPHMPEYYDVIVSKLGLMISEGLDADIN